MRYLVFIFILTFNFSLLAQEINQTDAKGNKQGIWKKYYENDMLRYTGSFKDDKPVGTFKYYYDSGELQVEMIHDGNVSTSKVYHITGGLKGEGKYVNQKKDGEWIYYDADGNKRAIEHYNMGKKDKKWMTYFPDGKIAEEKGWKDGIENGLWKQYFTDGQTKVIGTFVNGGLEGKAAYFRPDGSRGVGGNFLNGLREGVWKYFEADGQTVEKVEIYKKGRRVDKNKDDIIEDPNSIKPIPADEIFEGMGPE